MSKQSSRQLTRQERRREEQRRREEERQRAARTKRITTIGITTVVALAVVGLIIFAVIQNQAPANAAYPPIDKVSCQSTEQSGTHIHAHVSIYINGTSAPLPLSATSLISGSRNSNKWGIPINYPQQPAGRSMSMDSRLAGIFMPFLC